MSYDVGAGDREENYTCNLSPFFRSFDVYPPDWHGCNRYEVGREISAALRRIVATDKAVLDQYNASNGWGTWQEATRFLIRVWAGCFQELSDTVDVSW